MITGSFTGLLNNAILLLALGVIYDVLGLRSIANRQVREVLSGLLIGGIGIMVMLTPWELTPGVFFDTRSILLSLCGLFFGLIPTLIALVMTVAFRLFQGGAGALVGCVVLIVTAGVGLSWRYMTRLTYQSLTWLQLYLFGLVTHLFMLLCMFLLPESVRWNVLDAISLPVLAIYPVATMLLGLIIRRQRDRRAAERAIQTSENRFRSLFENSEVAIWNICFADVYARLKKLREHGVSDLQQYAQTNPQELLELISKIRVVQLNNAFLRLFGAKSKHKFLESKEKLLTPEVIGVFVDAFCAIWDRQKYFRAEVRSQTLSGKEKTIIISMPIPNREEEFNSVPVSILDITELKQAEERIITLSQAVEQSPVSVMITDPNGNIEYVNSAFEQLAGYSASEVKGKNPRILKSGNNQPEEYKKLWSTISTGGAWQGEFQNKKKNGDIFWENAHIAPVLDGDGTIRHYLAVKEDITRQKEQDQRILHQAHFDSLTDLPNRFLSLDRLTQLIKDSERNNTKVAVLFLDLDDFKKINDTLGHDAGDRLLEQAADRLKEAVREGDTIGRLGGDEFIMILGGLTDVMNARPAAENLLNRFRTPFNLDGRELILSVSIGISIYPDDGDSTVELLRSADTAMYCSKDQGRNTYNYFTKSMNKDVSRRLMLEEKLHGALERGEFYLCYQPIIEIKNRRVMGCEALLRWNNPVVGNILPDEFIPITEQTGLIVQIGRFVLAETLRMAAKWQNSYSPDFIVAVNLSPRQFRDPQLIDDINNILKVSGIAADSLHLEITEGVLLNGISHTDASLNTLNELGINIVMDDFGTGYSSLNYLRRYPFNTLKIDREFVSDITYDMGDRELVNAAIVMAHSLDLKVVAEGVETEEQLAYLESQGCDYAQGYLFSKPVSPAELTALLEEQVCSSE